MGASSQTQTQESKVHLGLWTHLKGLILISFESPRLPGPRQRKSVHLLEVMWACFTQGKENSNPIDFIDSLSKVLRLATVEKQEWPKAGHWLRVNVEESQTMELLALRYTQILGFERSELDSDVTQISEMKELDSRVDSISVSSGPYGSYTGLRIGAAFVNGLNRGRSRPLFALRMIRRHSLNGDTATKTPLFSYKTMKSDLDEILKWIESWVDQAAQGDEAMNKGDLEMKMSVVSVSEVVPSYSAPPGPVIQLRRRKSSQRERSRPS